MTSPDDIDDCPICGTRWRGDDIYECFAAKRQAGEPYWANKSDAEIVEAASNYGWTPSNRKCFSNLMGVTTNDRVGYWCCPVCNTCWDANTGELVVFVPIETAS